MKNILALFFITLVLSASAQNQSVLIPGSGNFIVVDVYNSSALTFNTWYADSDMTEDMFQLTDSTNNGRPVNAYMGPEFYVDRPGGVAFLKLDQTQIEYTNLANKPTLGTAAAQNVGAFATAAQGATADAAAPAAATTSALAGKEPTITAGTTGQYWRGDKTWATFPTNLSAFTNGPGYLTSVPAQSFSSLTGKPTTLSGYGITDAYPLIGNPSAFITQAGARTAISLTTTGTSGAATYNSGTGVLNVPNYSVSLPNTGTASTYTTVTTDAQGRVTAGLARVQNDNVARTLNSNYTISATQATRVYYSINVQWNLAALLSGSGAAFLEYSTNAGSSWITVSQVSKSIGLLTFAGADDLNLSGEGPAGALWRIRTTATNMTVTYARGQEVLS